MALADYFLRAGKSAAFTAASVISPLIAPAASILASRFSSAGKKPEPNKAMSFPIGEGLSNTTDVLPGPRITTVEAAKRGEKINTTTAPKQTSQKTQAKKIIEEQVAKGKAERQYLEEPDKVKGFVKDIVQAIPKTTASLALSATGQEGTFETTSPLQRAFLGERVTSMGQKAKDVADTADILARQFETPEQRKRNDVLANVGRLPLVLPAALAFGGIEALNVDPGVGALEKKGAEKLAKLTGREAAEAATRAAAEGVEQRVTLHVGKEAVDAAKQRGFQTAEEAATHLADNAIPETITLGNKNARQAGPEWKTFGNKGGVVAEGRVAPEVKIQPPPPIEKTANTQILPTLKKTQKQYLRRFMESPDGAEFVTQHFRELEDLKEGELLDNPRVVQAIKGTPHFKKEGSILDAMGEGILMEKGGKFQIAVNSEEINNLFKKGWKRGIGVDQLAQEAGFGRGEDYLNAVLQRSIKRTPETEAKAAEQYLLQTDETFRALQDSIKNKGKGGREALQKIERGILDAPTRPSTSLEPALSRETAQTGTRTTLLSENSKSRPQSTGASANAIEISPPMDGGRRRPDYSSLEGPPSPYSQNVADSGFPVNRNTEQASAFPLLDEPIRRPLSDASVAATPYEPNPFGYGETQERLIPESMLSPEGIPLPPELRGGIKSPELNLAAWEDKSAPGLGRETLERNLEGMAPKEDVEKLKKFVVDPIRTNETARIDFTNSLREEAENIIVKELGIKPGSKESALVQRFGEGRITKEELQALEPKNAENIMKAAEYFRAHYDQLIDTANNRLASFGFQPIQKRQNYFRHFQEGDGLFDWIAKILKLHEIPTKISGMTDLFRPSRPFSNVNLRRLGGEFTEDAVKGFDNYLDAISRQMFHTDSVQRVRALEDYLRVSKTELPNFVANLRDYGDLVSGKKARLDRAIESVFGRKIYGAIDTLRSRFAANAVGGNLSSAMTNFVPFTQAAATTEKVPFIKGLFEGLKSPWAPSAASIDGETSNFLTRRFAKKYTSPTRIQRVTDIATKPFELVDQFTARSIVAGKYYEGMASGLSAKEAMKAADDYAVRLMADRSVGQLPNLMSSKTMGLFLPFQTEVNNAMSFMFKDIPNMAKGDKKKIASALSQLVVFSYLFNEAYKNINGRRPAFDPLHAALTAGGLTEESQDSKITENLQKGGREILEQLPFTSLLLNGGRVPLASGIPSSAILSPKDMGQFVEEASKPITSFGLPFGGSQIRKTIQGAKAIKEGQAEVSIGTSKKGRAEIKSPPDIARALIFGANAPKTVVDEKERLTRETAIQSSLKASHDKVKQDLVDAITGGTDEEINRAMDALAKFNTAVEDSIDTGVNERVLKFRGDKDYKAMMNRYKIDPKDIQNAIKKAITPEE